MRGFALSTPVAAAACVASFAQCDQNELAEFIEMFLLYYIYLLQLLENRALLLDTHCYNAKLHKIEFKFYVDFQICIPRPMFCVAA